MKVLLPPGEKILLTTLPAFTSPAYDVKIIFTCTLQLVKTTMIP
jgi:hypothetical protein